GSASSPKATRSPSRADASELMPRDTDDAGAAADPATLATAVLTEEAKRQEEQAARSAVTILPDDLLPGGGEAQMNLGETLRAGGEPVPAVLRAGRRRLRPGVLGSGVRFAAHRHVSDPGTRARVLALLARAAGRAAVRPVRRRRDRDGRRGRRGLALDVPRAH